MEDGPGGKPYTWQDIKALNVTAPVNKTNEVFNNQIEEISDDEESDMENSKTPNSSSTSQTDVSPSWHRDAVHAIRRVFRKYFPLPD